MVVRPMCSVVHSCYNTDKFTPKYLDVFFMISLNQLLNKHWVANDLNTVTPHVTSL